MASNPVAKTMLSSAYSASRVRSPVGVIGILVGATVALLLPVVAGWTTVLPWNAIVLSFGVSAAIGMFFGIYPARKASQLDPIVALRYE